MTDSQQIINLLDAYVQSFYAESEPSVTVLRKQLEEIAPKHIDLFIQILQNPTANPDHRFGAAHVLGWTGDSRAFAPLVAALSDSDARPQTAAVTGLSELGDPRAIEPLTK